jgi:hypothetical protein
MSFRRLILLVVIAALAVAGVAMAAKGGGGKVTLCAAGDGALSAPKSGKCGNGERKLTVAAKGAPGPAGAVGPAGQAGAPGPAGTVPSLAPSATLIGNPGPDCATTPVFCSSATWYWGNAGGGYAPVGFQVDAAGGVHLQGRAQPTVSESGADAPTIFYLPPGLRPSEHLTFPVLACNGSFQRIYLRPSGAVEPSGLTCVPLDGIVIHP